MKTVVLLVVDTVDNSINLGEKSVHVDVLVNGSIEEAISTVTSEASIAALLDMLKGMK